MEVISLLSSKSITYDVIIIGAGIAGLAASKVLKENGISYNILEANNKLGGRAKRAPKNFGKWFDLGCSYLHNGDMNPLVKILESKSTPVVKSKGDMFSVEKTNFLFNGFSSVQKPYLVILFLESTSVAHQWPFLLLIHFLV